MRLQKADTTNPSKHKQQDDISAVELFFDLVFIFAMSQVSEHLYRDLTWQGLGESAVLLAVVFGVWSYTSFEATVVRVYQSRTTYMLLTVMLLGLFMNASINHAFDTEPWAFVLPYLTIQIFRPLWTIFTLQLAALSTSAI